MKNLKNLCLFSFMCTLSFQAICNEEKYANLTEADIQIVENGTVIHTTNILLLDENQATVTFFDTISNKPVSKIQVTSSKTFTNKVELINIEVDYSTYENYEWLTKMQSAVLNEPEIEGVVSVKSDTNILEVFVSAKSRDNEILQSDSMLDNIGLCSSQNKAKKGCCEKDCSDGSGNTMTCCNAVGCTACGVSCTPKESGTIGL